MKTFFEIVVLAGCLLAAFYFNLVLCGIVHPEKLEICSAYSWPVVGTAAKAQVRKALVQIAVRENR